MKKIILLFVLIASLSSSESFAQEGYTGEIRLFAGNFAPRGWALCNGALLAVNSNTALFSLLGTTYGGDGRSTFGLPDLRGRTAIGTGRHPGSNYDWRIGQSVGAETTTLKIQNLPAHTHNAIVTGLEATASASISIPVSSETGNTFEPCNTVVLSSPEVEKNNNEVNLFNTGDADETLKPFVTPVDVTLTGGTVSVGNTGSGSSFSNMQPTLTINYIICLYGVYPSRD